MGQILLDYAEYADIGLEEDAKGLAKHSSHDLPIQLVLDTYLPY
jgi:uncharacterized protein YceK